MWDVSREYYLNQMVWVSIIHPKCSFDGKIIEGKKMLRELLAEETLGNLKKLSDMRTKKVRNLRS